MEPSLFLVAVEDFVVVESSANSQNVVTLVDFLKSVFLSFVSFLICVFCSLNPSRNCTILVNFSFFLFLCFLLIHWIFYVHIIYDLIILFSSITTRVTILERTFDLVNFVDENNLIQFCANVNSWGITLSLHRNP